ncbi:MAG: PEP-CTERM sorting domain-containing protein [Alkalinema sp. RL_2_19]|nr:PEP-CTERM sorting domain-containing protein [Alkalinema sp. RL_2_19]
MSINLRQIAKISAVTATALCAATIAAPSQADAFELKWLGLMQLQGEGNGTGGSVFDYRGIAIKDSGDTITVAINGNMDLFGQEWGNGRNKKVINHGDLFFNFTGKSFKEASDAGELMAINFAQFGSETGAGSTGVYSGVTAKNTTTQNYGWNNLNSWKNAVKQNGQNNNSYGDLTSDSSYFAGQHSGSNKILNAINTGTKVGNIMMMNNDQLSSAGLDFGNFGVDGTKTLGFSFQKTAGFTAGSYIANLFMECGNDGVAIASTLRPNADKKVPEPTLMLGLAGVSGLAMMRRRQQKKA